MTLKDEKAKILAAYHNRSKALFAYDTQGNLIVDKQNLPVRAQNSWASAFWAGYDGMTHGVRVPPRNSISWAWYATGRDLRKNGGLKV